MTPDKFYDNFAREYDQLATEHEWFSPDLLFGLVFPFIPTGGKLVDIGIGTGLSSLPFHRLSYNITGVDYSPQMLEVCKDKHISRQLVLHDIRKRPWPLKDATFDVAISNGVLYFIKDLLPICAETFRILKHDGIFAFSVEPCKVEEMNNSYKNRSNSVIATTVPKAAGMVVYRHSDEYIKHILQLAGFDLLRSVLYHAYYSPTEERDVSFITYVTKKHEKGC